MGDNIRVPPDHVMKAGWPETTSRLSYWISEPRKNIKQAIAYGVSIVKRLCAKTPEAVKRRRVAERKERMVQRRWDGQGNVQVKHPR